MSAAANPDIVTDGLMLVLDPLDKKSYSGSGTSITNRGSETISITMSNATFNSTEKVFEVDGTDDYIYTSRVPNTASNSDSVTWGIWVNPAQNAGNIMSMSNTQPQGSWNMPPIAATGQKFRAKMWSNSYVYSSTFTTGQWYYLVFVWNYSATSSERGQFFYVNGELVGSHTGINYSASNAADGNYLYLGQSNPGADNTGMFAGKYGGFHVYEKSLTAAEILQNYNATKSRFGL